MAIDLRPSRAKSVTDDILSMNIREVIRNRYDSEKARTKDSQDPLVFIHGRKSCTLLGSGIAVARQLVPPAFVSIDLAYQTLAHKAVAMLGEEDDLKDITTMFGELDTINAQYACVSDVIESITKSPSPFSETLYAGREIKIAVSDKNRGRFNGFLPGTGLEQIEVVTLGMLLVFLGENIKEIAGVTAQAADFVKTYRNYLHERRIILEAWLNIAKFRVESKIVSSP